MTVAQARPQAEIRLVGVLLRVVQFVQAVEIPGVFSRPLSGQHETVLGGQACDLSLPFTL